MENLFYNISQVLGITIIHSLWQGLIIFIVLRLFVLGFTSASSVIKYRVAYSALALILGWFICTLFKELGHYNWLSTTALQVGPIALPAIMHKASAPANRYYILIAGYMPYLTILYVVGVIFNALRLTFAWNNIYRIRQNISNAGFEGTVKRLSAMLGLKKAVQTAFSEWVNVPCITGFIKPIILLPLSITCHLSTEEIEAILLHELAHIKRNDYLLNFIQQVIVILLFFNPFARLVSKLINEERENCCDDAVVQVTGSPFIYAQALLKLEENNQHQWQVALAATAKKYELLNRIKRIMETKNNPVNIRPILITLLALTCSISSVAWLNPEIKNGKVIIKNAPAIKMITTAITTTTAISAAKPAPAVKSKNKLSTTYANAAVANRLNDTSIKNKKFKIVIEDDKGNKKEYNSVSEMPAEDRNDFYRNSADVNYKIAVGDSARMVAVRNFYSSDKWKKQVEDIQKNAAKMAKQFNSPEWKAKQKQIIEKSAQIAKQFNSPEWKKKQELIAMQAQKSAQYYNSPEWKKQQEELVKMGTEIGQKFINSPEWKAEQDAIVKQALDIAKQFSGDNWKNEKEIQKQAEKAGKELQKTIEKMNKPEYKNNIKSFNPEAPVQPELPEIPAPKVNVAPKVDVTPKVDISPL